METETLHHDQPQDTHDAKDRSFDVVIVYGINKPLRVQQSETIREVKLAAMRLFEIPPSDEGQYVLRAKLHGGEQELPTQSTVEQVGLHPEQKVTLASGAPYGRR